MLVLQFNCEIDRSKLFTKGVGVVSKVEGEIV